MIRAVLFDLDDTLYPEGDFYRGGFAVAAELLVERGVGPANVIRQVFESIHFNEGREGVFDKAAARLRFPRQWIPDLVAVFHSHTPRLRLPQESIEVLTRLRRHYRLGIVTDGHGAVQWRKVEALGVRPLVDAIIVTDDLGREYWKPHPRPLVTCCRMLGVRGSEAVLVGDHPDRDMLAARNGGMVSIRLRWPGGYFYHYDGPADRQADFEIQRLGELEGLLAGIGDAEEASLRCKNKREGKSRLAASK